MLASLQFKKGELGDRLGPGHPDMISLTNQIKALEDELEKRGGPAGGRTGALPAEAGKREDRDRPRN